MSLLALSFVHPGILGGLALASLPIIIHILNRRRFKTMEWAAMEFLLKAAVRNRRRVRLENLLLLLLRTLLVALLVIAVARPFTRNEDALAALFGSEGATERVILLDDSHSMRAGQGNRSAFETAKQLVRRLVDRLHDEKSSDKVTLVLASRPREGGEGFARVAVASAQVRRLQRALDGLRATDASFDPSASIEAVLERFQDKEARLVLHVVSDFRSRDWAEADGSLRPDVEQALRAFAERGEVRLLDVGAPPVSNVGVVELVPEDRAVIQGVPATFVATVLNHGPDPVAHVSVEFRFGDRVELPVRVEGVLSAGQTAQVKKEFTFRTDGPAVVEARLPTDVLPGDDVRRRVVQVRPALRYLLVDGEPDPEPYRGETDFLAAALAPPGETASGVRVDVVTEYAFAGRDLEIYDGIFLCNVYRLQEERLRQLEEFVRAGGGLVIFLGDQVDPQVYNSSLFGSGERAGQGLMPMLLRDVEGSSEDWVHLGSPDLDHPLARFLRGMNRIIFRTVAVRRFLRGDLPATTDARVVLRYTDEDASPALVERAYGEGRVIVFTTAADLEWSDFPRSALYVLLLQESARHIARPDSDAYTLPVGAPIVIPYDPRRMAPGLSIVPPREQGGTPVEVPSSPAEDERQLLYRYDSTLAAGVYTARTRTPEGEPSAQPFALNMDASEGDLRRADPGPMLRAVPGLKLDRAGEETLFDTDRSDRTEFWRTLVYLLIAVAALETFLAWRFGHHKAREMEEEGKQVFVR